MSNFNRLKVGFTFDRLDMLVNAITRDILRNELPKLPLGAEFDEEAVKERVQRQTELGIQWLQERSPRVVAPSGIMADVWRWIRALAPVEVSGNASTARLTLETTGKAGNSIKTADGLVYSVRQVLEENFLEPGVMASGIAINTSVSEDLVFGSKEIMSSTAEWEGDLCRVRSAYALTSDQALLVAALELKSPITPQAESPDCFVQDVVHVARP